MERLEKISIEQNEDLTPKVEFPPGISEDIKILLKSAIATEIKKYSSVNVTKVRVVFTDTEYLGERVLAYLVEYFSGDVLLNPKDVKANNPNSKSNNAPNNNSSYVYHLDKNGRLVHKVKN